MKNWFVAGFGSLALWACGASSVEDEQATRAHQGLCDEEAPIGLSLFFTNGEPRPLGQADGHARYLQEIDLVESVATPDDRGIQPLLEHARLSRLDWDGLEQVEEIWSPGLDGTFTRERYFRGARWMDLPSVFRVSARNSRGKPLGRPWVVKAGRDDRRAPGDDVFVRRFVARQSAFGCPGVGDCEGAVFVAEALVQARGALRPEAEARPLPRGVRELRLTWNRLPDVELVAPVEDASSTELPFDHGFSVHLEPVAPPPLGYYLPGETASFRVIFRDGRGAPLHPPGELPTYGEFVAGEVASGLRYLDLTLQTRLYYALKHRESNLLAVLSGPTHRLRTPRTVVDPLSFFGPQVTFASREVDGFSAVGQTVPPAGIVFGGLALPELWSVPVSDVLTFQIPADAEAGTYLVAIKARRDFQGEALNRGASLELQVGQAEPTTFLPSTTCVSCHSGERTGFDTLLHGLDDRRACFGCHASLGIELDNALDIRVHTIHARSNRFGADIHDCAGCHLTPPDGPGRGIDLP